MSEKMVILVTGSGSGIGRAVAQVLAEAGHCVYASLRMGSEKGKARADELLKWAKTENADLQVIELDVLSEASCRSAVDQIVLEQGHIDVVVNNAGMLMVGMTEGFLPEQVAQIFDTNAISWLRVNRAVLPAMRRQGKGVMVYISSTTAHIFEPFMGPYVASKAAGEALAEVMGLEVTQFGIETVVVIPGAFTEGTEHFEHAHHPRDVSVVAQYGDLPGVVYELGSRLEAVDAANGGSLTVNAVGNAVRDVLAQNHGERPARLLVDAQNKGIEEINAVYRSKQTSFFEQMGIDNMMRLPKDKR